MFAKGLLLCEWRTLTLITLNILFAANCQIQCYCIWHGQDIKVPQLHGPGCID